MTSSINSNYNFNNAFDDSIIFGRLENVLPDNRDNILLTDLIETDVLDDIS